MTVSPYALRGLIGTGCALLAILLLAGGCAGGSDSGAAVPTPAAAPAHTSYPWLDQPDGAPSVEGVQAEASLLFAPSVDYATALRQLYVSVKETGRLPAGTELAGPLPPEVVLVRPSTPDRGLRLSLTAPWGWTSDGGLIRAPSIRFPGRSLDEAFDAMRSAEAMGHALPPGAILDVPELDDCQIAVDTPDRRPPCR